MNIIKERTRLIFSEYTESEKRYIEDMVASMDNIYMFEDKDKNILGLPTGMEERIRKAFPKATWTDKSDTYWPLNRYSTKLNRGINCRLISLTSYWRMLKRNKS